MRKNAIVVLVISAILVLCGLGLITGSFLSSSHYGVVRQNANGFMMSMRFSSSMPMAYTGSTSRALMFLILGCTLLNSGVVLLASSFYLFLHAGLKHEKRKEEKPVEPIRSESKATQKEMAEVVDVEEKQ
jgi:hypothetical protein